MRFIPVLADLTGVALYFLLGPWLTKQFGQGTIVNSLLIGLVFVLFCVAVYGLRKLEPDLPLSATGRNIWGGLAVIFSLFISIVTAYTVGFLDSTINLNRQILDEPSATLYLLITPASWFGLALIYVLVLSSPMSATLRPDTPRYPLVTYFSLLGINLMAVLTTAFWQALWNRFAPAGAFFIPLLLLALLLYGPPRLILWQKQGHWLSLLSFFLWLVFLHYLM